MLLPTRAAVAGFIASLGVLLTMPVARSVESGGAPRSPHLASGFENLAAMPMALARGAQAAPLADASCPQVSAGEPLSTVGLTELVDPAHAPVPSNDSERLLFRQLYETLVEITCGGVLQPALADAWRRDEQTGAWLLSLRPSARFADGTPVDAAAVVAAWTSGTALRPEIARDIQQASAIDARTVAVSFHPSGSPGDGRAGAAPLRLLADPVFAIAKRSAESPWPWGTRDLRLETPPAEAGGRLTMTLIATGSAATPSSSPATAPVRVLVTPGGDARDLLDRGAEVVLTREPAALQYAAALGRFESLPLPWRRTHLLVSPATGPADRLTAAARQALADDAVAGEARGSVLPWPETWESCVAPGGAPPVQNGAERPPNGAGGTASPAKVARIVHERSDSVARALAERLVALASVAPRPGAPALDVLIPSARSRRLQSEGLVPSAWAVSLSRGDEAAYVVMLDPSGGCAALASLRAEAPWVTAAHVVPLVDTRLRLLVRKGAAFHSPLADGTVLLRHPGAP